MKINKIIFHMKNDPRTFSFNKEQTELLRAAAGGAEIVFTDFDEDVLLSEAAGCDVAVAQNSRPLPETFFEQAADLKWVHCLMSGVDKMVIPEGRGIILTSTKGIHGVPISEHVLAMILYFSRNLGALRDAQKEHLWKRPGGMTELNGATAGIVGLGNIGFVVGSLLKNVGLNIVTMDRFEPSLEKKEILKRYYAPEEFDEFLKACDYIILNAPLTNETRHMFGKEQFRLMKNSAFIINVARGPIINEADLIEALKEGEIAGACLDVVEEEPLPSDSPLWDMPNVLISSHNANSSPRKMDRITQIIADNITRFVNDEELLFIENAEKR